MGRTPGGATRTGWASHRRQAGAAICLGLTLCSSSASAAPTVGEENSVDQPSAPRWNESAGVIASNGTGYLVVWTGVLSQPGNGLAGGGIYATRLDEDGNPLDSPVLSFGLGANPAVATVGSGYLVAWMSSATGSLEHILGATVSSAGSVSAPFVVSTNVLGAVSVSEENQETPWVSSNGSEYLVSWVDYQTIYSDASPIGSLTTNVYAARVGAAGNVIDTTGLQVTTTGTGGLQTSASDGTDFVAFAYAPAAGEIRGVAVPVSAAGVVGTATSVASTAGTSEWENTSLAFAGGQYLANWGEVAVGATGGDPQTQYGTLIAPSGALVSSSPITMCSGAGCSDSFVAPVGSGFYASWFQMIPGYPADLFYDVYGATVSSAGVVTPVPNGELVTATATYTDDSVPPSGKSGPTIAMRTSTEGMMLYTVPYSTIVPTDAGSTTVTVFRMRARSVTFDEDGGGAAVLDASDFDAEDGASPSGGGPDAGGVGEASAQPDGASQGVGATEAGASGPDATVDVAVADAATADATAIGDASADATLLAPLGSGQGSQGGCSCSMGPQPVDWSGMCSAVFGVALLASRRGRPRRHRTSAH
jgi:hypothetical protein